MPLQATSGAASYDAFGGGAAAVPNYIEDVFSTYLWTSVTNTQYNISNGIDLSTKGGMSWLKARNAALNNALFDTVRGAGNFVSSNNTNAESTGSTLLSSFNTDGFSGTAGAAYNYVGWTFRKQPKFFDIVTYTGTGTGNRSISHNLGSTPGCMIVKVTSFTDPWAVYHRSLTTARYFLELNTTSGEQDGGTAWWGNTAPTSTTFMVGTENNKSGQTYVAYLFAHDAGGFGLTGTDNVISCGSFITDASGNPTVVNLGYEPQWLLVKKSSASGEWFLLDTMRGMSMTSLAQLYANQNYAENTLPDGYVTPTATGFNVNFNYLGTSNTCIYIAIRRGPMKVPTSGTSVFSPVAYAGTGATKTVTAGFPVDLALVKDRTNVHSTVDADRLRGAENILYTDTTAAENPASGRVTSFASNTSITVDADTEVNGSGANYINWAFRRAPSFFDEVCATCPSSGDFQINHALGVVPEFVITKARSNNGAWNVYHKDLGRSLYLNLNTNVAQTTGTNYWNVPTTTTFGTPVGIFYASGYTGVFYLFATCAGVSKVGSYTGTGALQTVNCGFSSGARFVMIKRTDSTGDWYVWDTSRGLSSSTDPYLRLNSANAEVTGTNYVDTDTTGFKVTATANTTVNVSGGTFIFLAIA